MITQNGAKEGSVRAGTETIPLSPTVRGTYIGQKGAPSIVCLPGSVAFADTEAHRFISAALPNLESVNSGFQAHYLTNRGDCLMVRTPTRVGDLREIGVRDITETAVAIGAEIWRIQTGIHLASPTQGSSSVLTTPSGENLADFAAEQFSNNGRRFLATGLFPRALQSLQVTSEVLAQAIESHAKLNSKNQTLPLLAQHGVIVPQTLVFEAEGLNLGDLDRLNGDKTYILKPDGSAGGFGIQMKNGAGFSAQEIRELVSRLSEERKLPAKFQIQEFVKGTSLGAVAIFDLDGSFRISTIHTQLVENGQFRGITWEPCTQDLLISQVRGIFAKLAKIPGIRLLGPIGIDLQECDDGLYVIEVNPRITGASPIGVLLKSESHIAEHLEDPGFSIKSARLEIGIKIPLKLFEAPRKLRNLFLKCAAEHNAIFRDWGHALILPQGLAPFDGTKILFVNDTPNGDLRERFTRELQKLT